MPAPPVQTLSAYAIGLFPFVLIRSVTATFFARGDTATPVKASLTAVAVNVLLKIILMRPMAQVGLALATSIGAWLNLALVTSFAARRAISRLITTCARVRPGWPQQAASLPSCSGSRRLAWSRCGQPGQPGRLRAIISRS